MTAIIFTVQADANTYSAAVDAKRGYPRNGVDIGGGLHAAKAESQTVRNADVIKHPTLLQWAYTDASPAATDINKPTPDVALPVTGSVAPLDATWFPVVTL